MVKISWPGSEFVAASALHPVFEKVRAFVRDKLPKGKEPPRRDWSLMNRKPYVRVVGVLFFNDARVGGTSRGKRGCRSPTLWEIHPISEIRFAPKARIGWNREGVVTLLVARHQVCGHRYATGGYREVYLDHLGRG